MKVVCPIGFCLYTAHQETKGCAVQYIHYAYPKQSFHKWSFPLFVGSPHCLVFEIVSRAALCQKLMCAYDVHFIHVVYGTHCWYVFCYLNKSSINHSVEQTIACYVKRIHGFRIMLLNRMAKNKRFHRRKTLMIWCIHFCWALFQANQVMKENAEHY